MPTTQPRDCDFIVPSRFSAQRPRTWQLVMDDAGRMLAARHGSDMRPQRTLNEVELRSRDHRMREEVAKRRLGLLPRIKYEKVQKSHDNFSTRENVVSLQPQQEHFENDNTSAASFLAERIASTRLDLKSQKEHEQQQQRTTSWGIIPREVPVSSFH